MCRCASRCVHTERVARWIPCKDGPVGYGRDNTRGRLHLGLHSATSAILSAVIFNAIIILLLIPIALKGVKYRPVGRRPAPPQLFDLGAGRRDADLERVPADMVMASGSGLDPDITLSNVLWQLDRVAAAWAKKTGNTNEKELHDQIEQLLRDKSHAPLGGLVDVPLVNVLEVNLALRGPLPEDGRGRQVMQQSLLVRSGGRRSDGDVQCRHTHSAHRRRTSDTPVRTCVTCRSWLPHNGRPPPALRACSTLA